MTSMNDEFIGDENCCISFSSGLVFFNGIFLI